MHAEVAAVEPWQVAVLSAAGPPMAVPRTGGAPTDCVASAATKTPPAAKPEPQEVFVPPTTRPPLDGPTAGLVDTNPVAHTDTKPLRVVVPRGLELYIFNYFS